METNKENIESNNTISSVLSVRIPSNFKIQLLNKAEKLGITTSEYCRDLLTNSNGLLKAGFVSEKEVALMSLISKQKVELDSLQNQEEENVNKNKQLEQEINLLKEKMNGDIALEICNIEKLNLIGKKKRIALVLAKLYCSGKHIITEDELSNEGISAWNDLPFSGSIKYMPFQLTRTSSLFKNEVWGISKVNY
jgi:hypothetical protein